MSEERFLWNRDRTEMVRVGAIKQIAIAEIGGTYPAVPPERGSRRPTTADKSTWVVRVHFIYSAETMVLGIFDSLDEARRFAEELRRHAEGTPGHEPVHGQVNESSVA